MKNLKIYEEFKDSADGFYSIQIESIIIQIDKLIKDCENKPVKDYLEGAKQSLNMAVAITKW